MEEDKLFTTDYLFIVTKKAINKVDIFLYKMKISKDFKLPLKECWKGRGERRRRVNFGGRGRGSLHECYLIFLIQTISNKYFRLKK